MGRDYRKIKAFQLADDLVILIYKYTKKFPKEELFGLTSQTRRAAVSIPANIAEGATRESKKRYLQFLYFAMGSMSELEYYIHLSRNLGYLDKNDYEVLESKRKQTAGKLYRLMESVKKETKGSGCHVILGHES